MMHLRIVLKRSSNHRTFHFLGPFSKINHWKIIHFFLFLVKKKDNSHLTIHHSTTMNDIILFSIALESITPPYA
jgi:phage terminase large subunit